MRLPDRFVPLADACRSALDEEADLARTEGKIGEAVATVLQTPGKLVRPVAVLLAGESLGARRRQLLPFAVAVEMVHTSSLILDDLPAMDDADRRRGAPTLHLRVGEADAILTAFALLSRAFRRAAELPDAGRKQKGLPGELVGLLEDAVGSRGMCEGQCLDLRFGDSEEEGLHALEEIHRKKTGALFAAALEGGGRIAGAQAEERLALLLFGKNLGLAFQMADDLLDVRGDPDKMGKPAGTDRGRRRTFVSLFGEKATEEALHALHRTAREALAPLGRRGKPLLELADYLERRDA